MGLLTSTDAEKFRKASRGLHDLIKKEEGIIERMIREINSGMETLERLGLPNSDHARKDVERILNNLLNMFFNLKDSYPRSDVYVDIHRRLIDLLKLSRNVAFGKDNPYLTQLGYLKPLLHNAITELRKAEETFKDTEGRMPN